MRITAVALWAALIGVGCSTSCSKSSTSHTRSQNGDGVAKSDIAAPRVDQCWGAAPPTAGPRPKVITWEAENVKHSDFPAANPFAPQSTDEAAKLSGGRWIGVEKPGRSAYLEYEIKATHGGRYSLYARKFWKHGPFRWRFDDQPYRLCGNNPMLLDGVALRRFVGVNWVALGDVELLPGTHRFRVELTDPEGVAAFDRFMLVEGDYIPSGLGLPEEESTQIPSGWVSVGLDVSVSDPAPSKLDLRALNAANRERFEVLRAQGGRIIREGSGATERLFGVNVGPEILSLPKSLLRRHVQWLASLGVNFVRFHGPVFRENAIEAIDRERVEALLDFHAALKSEGIYLGLSIVSPSWVQLKGHPKFRGYQGNPPYGLSYFREEFAEIQRVWWRELMAASKANGAPGWAEDPSVAYLELINEDSSLFWTMAPYSSIPEPETEELERKFGEFVVKRHGSIAQAMSRWQSAPVRGDHPDQGRVGMMDLYQIANRRDARSRDTAEFLTLLMRDFYANQLKELREQLGYRGLTVCSNWRTADARVLDPLDKWANGICNLMDHHGYYQGPHRGDAAGYSVAKGQEYDDRSSLRFDSTESNQAEPANQLPPIAGLRISGKPHIVSEIGWPWPNRFRAEYAPLVVGYGSLLGLDGVALFADGHPRWARSLDKFTVNEPTMLGQFPAAALAFRQGMISEGQVQVSVSLPPSELFALKGLPVAVPRSFDGVRLKDLPVIKQLMANDRTEIDPLAYLVGPVELAFQERAAAPADGVDRIDREARVVTSNTRELRLDYGRGLLTIDAGSVQAVAGFLRNAGRVSLAFAEFELDVDYGSVFLVAMDGQPLSKSGRILLQVVSEVTNAGFDAPGTGVRPIREPGLGPILMRALAGTIRLKRTDAAELTVLALQASGHPLRRSSCNASEIPLLPDVLYYLIESRSP